MGWLITRTNPSKLVSKIPLNSSWTLITTIFATKWSSWWWQADILGSSFVSEGTSLHLAERWNCQLLTRKGAERERILLENAERIQASKCRKKSVCWDYRKFCLNFVCLTHLRPYAGRLQNDRKLYPQVAWSIQDGIWKSKQSSK